MGLAEYLRYSSRANRATTRVNPNENVIEKRGGQPGPARHPLQRPSPWPDTCQQGPRQKRVSKKKLARMYSSLDLLTGRCQVILKKDVPLVFGGHKPIAEQGIVMRNTLRGAERIPIPGAMPILDQGDIIVQATGLPARRIDAHLGLNTCNDELLDAVSAQVLVQICLVKRVRHLLLHDRLLCQGCDGGMDLPPCCCILQGVVLALACVLNIHDRHLRLAGFQQQAASSREQLVSLIDRVGGGKHADLHINHYEDRICTHGEYSSLAAICFSSGALEQERLHIGICRSSFFLLPFISIRPNGKDSSSLYQK